MSAYYYEFGAIFLYLCVLVLVGYFSYRKHLSSSDFIIGSRSLNYWLTALAAHASDMSSWLFMGYPAIILTGGMPNAWAAVGLIIFMLLNWQIVAPKIRVATEQYNSLTFSSFFESRLSDTSGHIRLFTAIMLMIFYTIYVSAMLVGLGLLMENLFNLNYYVGVLVATAVVVPYVFIGGYVTLAWIDLFQGFFLMGVIIIVPLYILGKVGGFSGVSSAMHAQNLPTLLIPDWEPRTLIQVFYSIMGWGLGYFGQPHIVTKFMGIKNVHEISKSKLIGMSWMTLSLAAATLVGLVGIAYFHGTLKDSEQVFILMVRDNFNPFLIGLILCAVLAATINAMSSQILVLSSSVTEDFYRRIFRRNAGSRELLLVSRMSVIVVALLAFLIAAGQISTIYGLVLYAWSGLGSSFGPLIILCLYSRYVNKYGAWAGILSGGCVAAIWPYFASLLDSKIPSLLPGFCTSFILILIISTLTRGKEFSKEVS